MSDPHPPQGTSGLTIPQDTQNAFGPIIELIKGSESMNNEERQYWINILPIMTPEQIKNLQEILQSEKQQLAAIDAKYAKQSSASSSPEETEQKIRKRKQERQKSEEEEESKQKNVEEDILSKIQSL